MDETRTKLDFYGIQDPRTRLTMSRPGKEDVNLFDCFPTKKISFEASVNDKEKDTQLGSIVMEIEGWPFFGIEAGMVKIPEINLRSMAAAHGFKLVAIEGEELDKLRDDMDFVPYNA